MSTLTDMAKKHIERTMQELSGDDDFMPFLTIRDSQDRVAYVGMMMPDGVDERDRLADMMTALCMVHRGVEVTFAAVTWMVWIDDGKQWTGDVAPSEHPDRVEQAFLMTQDAEKRCSTVFAPVIRENDKIGVGLWSDWEEQARGVAFGRFAEAIRMGIGMGQDLPPDLCEWIDTEMEAGRQEVLVGRFVELLIETRDQLRKERTN